MLQQPALLGGLFIGVLSALPILSLGNCCCLWFVGGGALAAYLQFLDEPGASLPAGEGARAGLMAGVVGAVVWLVAVTVLQAILEPFERQVLDSILANASNLPPEWRPVLESLAESASAPGQWLLGFAFQLVAGAVFGAVGGLLGSAMYSREAPPSPGGPSAP